MKRKGMILILSLATVLLFLGCAGEKKPTYEQTVSKEVDILAAKVDDTDLELTSIQKYIDAMKRDITLDIEKIEDSMKRLETSQAAIKQSLNNIKNEQRRLQEEKGGLPFLAKFIIVVVIIVLIIIAYKIFRTKGREEEEEQEFGEIKREEGPRSE
jgi:septal ring factor EnvC (AmiA/AmiB activator)